MRCIIRKKTVKRMAEFLMCVIMPLILSGCWDRIEVNDLAIVVATGLDKTEEGEIELSVQIVNPKSMGSKSEGGQGGGKQNTVEKTTGKTIFDARSKLQEKVSRKLFWGHNHIIFIGKKLAEEGIRKHLDFFSRHPFTRLRASVFMTNEKPDELLKIEPDLERSSAEVAKDLAMLKVGLSVTAKDLLDMLSGEKRGAALPMIQIEREPPNTEGLKIYGAAIFNNGKMTDQLDDKEVRGLLWIRDEIDTASVTINPEEGEELISFHIFDATSKLIPSIENGNWKIKIEIVSEDDIVENETKLDMMNPKIIEKLKEQLEKQIVERVKLALEIVQKEMKVDVLGFEEAFHRHYPDEWRKANWEEVFPEIEVEVVSEVKIRRPGRSTAPQGVPENEVIGN
ncbi:hypothetical protein CIL03_05350 [Virgibacillus indicus]|uniref:Uncharacterized protein n=1 Tax=Virgibacillus indicus TaxID=2024554 RepID=A0A265NFG7_9BACI|nr:Ger(x)C family spore germination protein [Virgibacillus indicus]OZU90571.1 hypothetical protein CIL03_05350 [Virgibacillus indicus]